METTLFHGETLSRLGFGMMRLPVKTDGSIDEELVETMVKRAIDGGVNYFDTAFPYHGGASELVAGRVLKKYPREAFNLASKYPGHQYADSYHPEAIFELQLKKCQVDYFDYYLLHNVCESCIDVYRDPKWGIIDYFVEQKRLGRIRHLGFSSHADVPLLKSFVEAYGNEMEFCQIQLNYLDWTLQKGREKYELLTEHKIPVWVMEPVRGGRLAHLSSEDEGELMRRRPDETTASWAFRWLRRLPNVQMILSGMSTMSQVEDNLKTFSDNRTLNSSEVECLERIADHLGAMIPCTGCRYCCEGCPQKLEIPGLLNMLNDVRFSSKAFTVPMRLESMPSSQLPTSCIGCGACAQICPQHLDIPGLMKEFSGLLGQLPSWKKICEERAEAARKLVTR